MQHHTIVNSFRDSGMWPPSAEKALKKMREYKTPRKRTMDEMEADEPDLPLLPSTRYNDIWNTTASVRNLASRHPHELSEPSI